MLALTWDGESYRAKCIELLSFRLDPIGLLVP